LNEKRTHGRTNHGGEAILELTVAPAGAGKFAARLDGRELCVSTKPFLDDARVLLAEGADPATVLEMRHGRHALHGRHRRRPDGPGRRLAVGQNDRRVMNVTEGRAPTMLGEGETLFAKPGALPCP
jgi:hypothetical protein